MSRHATHDPESTFGILEIPILYPCLDHVQWRGHDQRGACTRNGGNEVLEPTCFVIIAELKQVFFGEGGAAE